MIDYWFQNDIPDTHPQTLILKTRYTPGGMLAAALSSARELSDEIPQALGLAEVERLERSGKITAVDTVSGPGVNLEGHAPPDLTAMSALAQHESLDDPTTATILRFASDVDMESLSARLDSDPLVEFASRVPVRYLAMPVDTGLEPRATTTTLDLLEARVTQLENRAARRGPQSWLWNLRRIGLADIDQVRYDHAGDIRVGVLDTGVDTEHPALIDRVRHAPGAQLPTDRDLIGHGTHVAGTINCRPNSRLNTRGICDAQVLAWKIFDDEPDYLQRGNVFLYLVDPVRYRRALAQCVGAVDVVNLSIGGPQPPDRQEEALFQALLNSGTTIVAAMGNERSSGSRTSYPAAIPGVVAVGATSVTDSVAPFSNQGDHIALSAPGVGIWSTMPRYAGQVGFRAVAGEHGRPVPGAPIPREIDYAAEQGTSMASPHVAAAAAILLANSHRPRTPQDVRDILMATASPVPDMGTARWSRDFGYGMLNLERLLLAAENL